LSGKAHNLEREAYSDGRRQTSTLGATAATLKSSRNRNPLIRDSLGISLDTRLDVVPCRVRLNPDALLPFLPPLRLGAEVAELDVRPRSVRCPIRADMAELEDQEAPADFSPLDGSCSVGQDELLVELHDWRRLVVLPRDELDDGARVAPSIAAGCHPVRVGVVSATDPDAVADLKCAIRHTAPRIATSACGNVPAPGPSSCSSSRERRWRGQSQSRPQRALPQRPRCARQGSPGANERKR
jgi:hypothetical protein